MGLLESRQINSAIKSDGLQAVKKVAFTYCAIDYLNSQKPTLIQNIESVLEERLSKQIQYIQQQRETGSTFFNSKVNQISLKDSDLIDRLQTKRKKSFKEIIGYKRFKQEMEKTRNKLIKQWNSKASYYLKEISFKSQQLKQKLISETPSTPALSRLQPQMKRKVLAKFINDEAYEIEKDQYKNRAIDQLEKLVDLDNVIESRFSDKNLKDQVGKILQEFRQNLDNNQFVSEGCGC